MAKEYLDHVSLDRLNEFTEMVVAGYGKPEGLDQYESQAWDSIAAQIHGDLETVWSPSRD